MPNPGGAENFVRGIQRIDRRYNHIAAIFFALRPRSRPPRPGMLSGFAKPSAASGLIGNARPHPSEARMIDALSRPWKRGIRNRATHACSAKPSFGVFAPSGTPEPLQARLFEVVSNALQETDDREAADTRHRPAADDARRAAQLRAIDRRARNSGAGLPRPRNSGPSESLRRD